MLPPIVQLNFKFDYSNIIMSVFQFHLSLGHFLQKKTVLQRQPAMMTIVAKKHVDASHTPI